MREDMAKVLIEDGRAGGYGTRKYHKRLRYDPDSDYEDEPNFVSSSRWRNVNHKQSTDVLGPLEGYLHSKVGQPWDAVYSELCQHLDRRSVTGAHVFTHLWDYVEPCCFVGAKTGHIYAVNRLGEQRIDRSYRARQFYVHPWTGLLCVAKPDRFRYKKPKPVDEVPIVVGKCYRRIDGIWYYTETSTITLYKGLEYQPDLYSWRRNKAGYTTLQSYDDLVIHKKRQLGKKELRDLKLKR